MNEYDKIWSQCLAYIQSQINDNVAFETFYANSKLAYIGQGKARIVVETQFGDVVLRNRLDLIIEALKQVTTQQYEVEILTQDALAKREEEKNRPKNPSLKSKTTSSIILSSISLWSVTQTKLPRQPVSRQPSTRDSLLTRFLFTGIPD